MGQTVQAHGSAFGLLCYNIAYLSIALIDFKVDIYIILNSVENIYT